MRFDLLFAQFLNGANSVAQKNSFFAVLPGFPKIKVFCVFERKLLPETVVLFCGWQRTYLYGNIKQSSYSRD